MTAVLLAHDARETISSPPACCTYTSQMLNHLKTAFGILTTFVDAAHPEEFAEGPDSRNEAGDRRIDFRPLMEVADLPAIVSALGSARRQHFYNALSFAAARIRHRSCFWHRNIWMTWRRHAGGCRRVAAEIIRKVQLAALYGVNSNPFECWLASRGIEDAPLANRSRFLPTADRIAVPDDAACRGPRVLPGSQPTIPAMPGVQFLFKHGFGGDAGVRVQEASRPSPPSSTPWPSRSFSPTLADARTTLSYPSGTSHNS